MRAAADQNTGFHAGDGPNVARSKTGILIRTIAPMGGLLPQIYIDAGRAFKVKVYLGVRE